MIVILGAGLTGLSSSFHIGHDKCILYEKNSYPSGHVHSEFIDGFTWDEGPHVSFTKNKYVQKLFEESIVGEFLEYSVKTTNYFSGHWIPHPAQTNLFAIPQPLREQCLADFLNKRKIVLEDYEPGNYREWLEYSFGETFAINFPTAYTKKYWTLPPDMLTTDWVGERVFYPNVKQVKEGYLAPLEEETHYIKAVRYPRNGGFMSFANKLVNGANVKCNFELSYINFSIRKITFSNGLTISFDKLINTIPLPFLLLKSDAPSYVKEAATKLQCTAVLLINVTAAHPTARFENWIYVYDEKKYSTRINCTELLSPNNAPVGKTGVQVEVYFSEFRQIAESHEEIAKKVIDELIEMKLIISHEYVESYDTRWIQYANVIFDHNRTQNMNIILNWLTKFGLVREEDDLLPSTNWNFETKSALGSLILAGRFGQWKYYWTDDCVLRGKWISENINS